MQKEGGSGENLLSRGTEKKEQLEVRPLQSDRPIDWKISL